MRIVLGVFMLLCTLNTAFAQHTVSGILIDERTQEPLIGALVQEKGTSNGVVTDIDGSYEIKIADANGSLVFSYLGYKSITRPVEGQLEINIALSTDGVQLDEIVVTGLSLNRPKR